MINDSTINVLQAAKIYIERGWSPMPVLYKSKTPPKDYKWREITCTNENVAQCFPSEKSNIGIRLGKYSDNLIDIDVDCPEAIVLAPKFLPHTDCVFGRKSKPNSHYFFNVDIVSGTKKFEDPQIKGKGKTIVEYRGHGGFTVSPPSTHEDTGEIIAFSSDGKPSLVTKADLFQAVEKLATASLIVRYWNQKGIRQDIAMALSGLLLKNGWSDERAAAFIYDIASAAGDEEAQKRADTVKYTRERMDNNEAVYGFNKLKELLPDKVAKKVVEWLGLKQEISINHIHSPETDDLITEMNMLYAVIMVNGNFRVLKIPKPHEEYDLQKESDFRSWCKNKKIFNGKSQVQVADYWLHHPDRRAYKGIKFYPGTISDDYYNSWHGLKYQSIQGDCSLYLGHIAENIAGGNDEIYNYIICWMASIIQRPDSKLETALVLRGREGTGKGVFAHEFGYLFGKHYCYVAQNRHLLGHFNSQLEDKVIIFADEAFYAGDKVSENILKSIISEKTMMVEQKFFNPRQASNFLNLIIASNNQWVVPAGLDARRFVVLDIGDAHMQDAPYFKAIKNQMEQGGREALVDYLMSVDISDFDHRQIPRTNALVENKLSSLNGFQKFWFEAMMQGRILKTHDSWTDEVLVDDLYDEVVAYEKNIGLKYRTTKIQMGQELNRLCPDVERKRKSQGSRRIYYYRIPRLNDCREAFELKTRMKIEWDDTCDASDTLCEDGFMQNNLSDIFTDIDSVFEKTDPVEYATQAVCTVECNGYMQ